MRYLRDHTLGWHRQGQVRGGVQGIAFAGDGTLWSVGTFSGVHRLVGGSWEPVTTDGIPSRSSDGLSLQPLHGVDRAADGTLWVTTSQGIASFAVDQWRPYDFRDRAGEFLRDHIMPPGTCVAAISRDVVLVGATGGVLCLTTDGRTATYPLPASHWPSPHERLGEQGQIRGLAVDADLTLWAATARGIGELRDGQDWRFHDLGRLGAPTDVLVDPDGQVWAVTPGGLARHHGAAWAVIEPSLEPEAAVSQLAVHPDGTLWGVAGTALVHLQRTPATTPTGAAPTGTAAPQAQRPTSEPPTLLAADFLSCTSCHKVGAIAWCRCVAPAAGFLHRGQTVLHGPGNPARELLQCRTCREVVTIGPDGLTTDLAAAGEISFLEQQRRMLAELPGEPLVELYEAAIRDALVDVGPADMTIKVIDAIATAVHQLMRVHLRTAREGGHLDDTERSRIRLDVARLLRRQRHELADAGAAGQPHIALLDGIIERLMPIQLA